MASLANIQDAINKEKAQAGQAEERPPIATTTNAPEIERSESAHPPGAWVDDARHSAAGDGESATAGIGESIMGALGMAGSTAAQYLPAGLVNSVVGYAPGVAGPSKSASGSTTDVSTTADDATSTSAAPVTPSQFAASKDQFVFKSSQADLNAPVNVDKDLGWQAPAPARSVTQDSLPEMSINKDSGSEVPSRRSTQEYPSRSTTQESTVPTSQKAGLDTAAQFVDPDVLTPLSPQSIPSVTNVGAGRPNASVSGSVGPSSFGSGPGKPAATVSTTAVTGHSSVRSGIEPPPPSAATLLSPSQGPLASNLPLGTPTPPAGLGVPKNDNTTAPSSVVSVKSGVVGSGPTDELGSSTHSSLNANKSLPPTPAGGSMMQDGVTPRGSELEEDLQYLAPHIRQQNSTAAVPTSTAKPTSEDHGSVGTGGSRFDEGTLESAHPTPASEISDSHSRESSVSEGGTRRVSIVKRIRGEAKIIAGKIKKDEGKVAEGKAMLHGEA